MSGGKNGATTPQANTEADKLRLEKEAFEAEKAEFEASKTAETESKATTEAEANKLAADRKAFEAEKVELAKEKTQLEAEQDQAKLEAEAFAEKKAQIKDYQKKVRAGNKEMDHIDFNNTGITFIGDEKVGKPTAKAPTKIKIEGKIVDIEK